MTPIPLHSVSIAWQSGPTLTQLAPIVDRWTFAGELRVRHLKAMLDEHANDVLAWNLRTQVVQVASKLGEWTDSDPIADAEQSASISDLESFGVVINYQSPVLTLDVPVKIGGAAKTVRITIERLADAIRVE